LFVVGSCSRGGYGDSERVRGTSHSLSDPVPDKRSADRLLFENLRAAYTAIQVLFTDSEDFTTATPSVLHDVEPRLSFGTSGSTAPDVMSIATPTASTFQLAAMSASGECFRLSYDARGVGATYARATVSTCSAEQAIVNEQEFGPRW
jgi:type IV pilus assembly protein PilA